LLTSFEVFTEINLFQSFSDNNTKYLKDTGIFPATFMLLLFEYRQKDG